MPTVFDNLATPFLENDSGNGLKDALTIAERGDFCVGYFNLRGWRCIDSVVAGWPLPASEDDPPPCRLLVGMQRLPQEQLRAWLAESPDRPPDLGQLAKLRKEAAREFRKQLTVGQPTDADEAGLQRLVRQRAIRNPGTPPSFSGKGDPNRLPPPQQTRGRAYR